MRAGTANPPDPTPSSSPKGSGAWPETPKLITSGNPEPLPPSLGSRTLATGTESTRLAVPSSDRPRASGGSFSLQDFSDPALVLFEAMDFEEGASVELSEALPDTQLAGYGTVTQSIHVLSGV